MTGPTITMKVAFRTCRRSAAEPRAAAKPVGPSAIARRVALAHFIEKQIDAGVIRDLAEAARLLGITRARMTQIADLRLLAPSIRAAVLLGEVVPTDLQLRITGRSAVWAEQEALFKNLFSTEGSD